MTPSGEVGIGPEAWRRAQKMGYDIDWMQRRPVAGGDFRHGDPWGTHVRDLRMRGLERVDPGEGGDWGPFHQGCKLQAQPCQFDGMGALSEFLRHFRLVNGACI